MRGEPDETGFKNVEFGELRMLGLFHFVVASGHLMLEPEEHIGQAQDQGLNWRVRLEDEGQQTVFYHDQGVVDILVVASLFGVSSAKADTVLVHELLYVRRRDGAPECLHTSFDE